MSSKIIITGATSMIGTALTEAAVSAGTEVYAVIRPHTRRLDRLAQSPLVHPVSASLETLKDAEDLPGDCDVFYHFAWAGTGKEERDNPDIQERNIRYTLDAVDLAERCGCRTFIGAGSQAEYGPVEGVIDASTRFSPRTAYGAAKYAAGLLSRKKCDSRRMIHIWGRIFSVYGPHDNPNTMLSYAIRCFSAGEAARFSSGVQMWDYLYERDAGKLFYLLGLRGERSGAYRVAGGQARPLRDYIRILAEQMHAASLCRFAAEEEPRLPGLEADIRDLVELTGCQPDTRFEDGIAETIQNCGKLV